MISISICDDEELELMEIEAVVEQCLLDMHISFDIQLFQSSVNLLYEISDHRVSDIYILDVSMPEHDGFFLAEEIRRIAPNTVIIFLTSYGEYATTGYLYEAHRYVLKINMPNDLPEALISAVKKLPNSEECSVVVRHYNDAWKIPYSNIISVTRVNRQLHILTLTQGEIKDSRGIRAFYEQVDDERFLFIDRGCFINIDYASCISGSTIRLTTGQVLPISRRSLQSVKSAILHRWGE